MQEIEKKDKSEKYDGESERKWKMNALSKTNKDP